MNNGPRVAILRATMLGRSWRLSFINKLLAFQCACLLLACVAGCGKPWGGPTPQVKALRAKFLSVAEPGVATPLAEVRKGLDARQQVVVAGRIGVPDQESWIDGKAGFMIRDAANETAADHGGKSHDPASCPFCKRKASQPESTAFVQFLDERGELILIDARELFDLSANKRVVVQGTAQLLEPGLLIVSAHKLFITPE